VQQPGRRETRSSRGRGILDGDVRIVAVGIFASNTI